MAGGEARRDSAAERPLVAVAEVTRPHGLGGEVRLRLYNPESTLLGDQPPAYLRMPDGALQATTLQSVRAVPGGALVRFSHVSGRDDAEQLRGATVCVPREALPPIGPEEFYVCDVEGSRALLDGATIGTVERIATYPTCETLVIAREDGTEIEVPLHEDFVVAVRIDRREVELRTLEGLE